MRSRGGVGAAADGAFDALRTLFGAALLGWYDNVARTEGSLSSVLDRSTNARHLGVSGTASAKPVGFPRNWAENGQPVIGFNSGNSQYAQDAGSSPTSYWQAMHQAGSGFVAQLQLLDASAEGQLFGTWNGSSNANSFSCTWDGSVLRVYVTSTTGVGTVHITAATVSGDLRPGDVVRLKFLHQTDKTWSLNVKRRRRDTADGSSDTTLTPITGNYSSTINNGAEAAALTIGNYTGLAGTYKSFRLHTLVLFTITANSQTAASRLETWLDSLTSVTFLSYQATAALVRGSHFDPDFVHWNDAGNLLISGASISAEQAMGTALNWSGTKRVAFLGDSRFAGTGTSAANKTIRYLTGVNPFTGFTHLGYGPVDDGTGNAASRFHWARSAYVTRSVASSGQLGHSQRSAHSASVDVGADAVTGTHRATDLFHIAVSINQLNASLLVNSTWDFADELARMCEYLIAQRRLFDGKTPVFILYTEPISPSTTTGLLQRLIRAYNREIHALAAYLRNFTTVYIVQTNDETDNH